LLRVESRDVGLDVEERCAIKNVHVLDMEDVDLDSDQTYDRDTDRVGTSRGAGGKHPMVDPIHKRAYGEMVLLDQVKVVEQQDVRKAVEIL
jgi:hypothetical protein